MVKIFVIEKKIIKDKLQKIQAVHINSIEVNNFCHNLKYVKLHDT